ncbi:MAG: hypothetical protein AAFO04_09415 [Cyanobacteria bacterium J06592_8]
MGRGAKYLISLSSEVKPARFKPILLSDRIGQSLSYRKRDRSDELL